ncbi:MAG: FkbM family methyltransferase, partial [Solirubrobacterales bacterium]
RRVVQELRDLGIDLVSVAEGFDTGVAGGPSLERTLDVFVRLQPKRASDRPRSWDPEGLRAHGCEPATIIDVGAASGTHSLYGAFEQAYLVLVEPLREYEQDLRKVLARRPGEYVAAAAGAEEGVATIGIDRFLVASSLLEQVGAPPPVEAREVPVRTIDRLAAERDWQDPLALKLDVEGFEREVINGAAETLKRCDFVIAELSVTPRFEGGPAAAELIARLRSHGFEACDVVDAYRAREHVIADLMFKRVAGPGE